MKHITVSLVLLLILPSCKPNEESAISEADREMLASLKSIQVEHNLTDVELAEAVGRYCKIFKVVEEAFDEGLITMDMYKNMGDSLREVESGMLESDAMAATISLAVLMSHRDGTLETRLPFLRKTVANHYNDERVKENELYDGFIRKVDDYSTNDEELILLLNKSG